MSVLGRPILLGNLLRVVADFGLEGADLTILLILPPHLLVPHAFCLLPPPLNKPLNNLLPGDLSFGPFGVDVEGQVMDVGGEGVRLGLNLPEGANSLDGGLVGSELHLVAVVVLDQLGGVGARILLASHRYGLNNYKYTTLVKQKSNCRSDYSTNYTAFRINQTITQRGESPSH